MLSHITVCSASAVLRYGVLGECCLALRGAWRVLSCITGCLASAVLRYGVLGECCLALRVLGECYLVSRCAHDCCLMLRHARRVPSHVTACSGVQCCVTACSANVLTRFNKIAISNNKFQMARGQGSHWLIESPTISHLYVARPYQISINSIFKHIHTTSINTIFGSLFHSFNLAVCSIHLCCLALGMLGECCVACLASAILRHGVLGECHFLDRRVLSHVTACLASAVLRNGVLGECCVELPHAQ